MPQEEKEKSLSGVRKAAILLLALGDDLSARVFKHFDENEIEKITLEIAALEKVPPEVQNEVLEEAYELSLAQEYVQKGGFDYARKVLEQALGPERAKEIIQRLQNSLRITPFGFIRKADISQVLNFLQNEHPQTIALVLVHLSPGQAASILSSLPREIQSDVAERIALMDRTSPEIIKEVERMMERKFSAVLNQEYSTIGGVQALASIMNNVDRSTEKAIFDVLSEKNPELTDEVKNLMFVFEDVIILDDRAVQRVLRDVSKEDLALALKGASDEVKEKIFKNMSKRAAEALKEDMDYMGPVRVKDVEEAQRKIVNIIRKLDEAGEIIISRGGEGGLIG